MKFNTKLLLAFLMASALGPSAMAQNEEPQAEPSQLLQTSPLTKRPVIPDISTKKSETQSLPGKVVIDKSDILKKRPTSEVIIPDRVIKPVPEPELPQIALPEYNWGTLTAVLPGQSEPSQIPYSIQDGIAVLDGDIELGRVNELNNIWKISADSGASLQSGEGNTVTVRQGLNAVINTDMLWPNGRIPYRVSGLPAWDQAEFNAAIQTLNTRTNLTLVPRTNDQDFVDVIIDNTIPGAGRSEFGRKGDRQILRLKAGACGRGCIIHEFLHAAGIAHEQSRSDRDRFVEIIKANVRDGVFGNFEFKEGSQPVGPYDFDSIMHYGPRAFSKPGCTGAECITIRAKSSTGFSGTLGGNTLTNTDISGINAVYPAQSEASGFDWGDGAVATAVAVGDLNGDGKAEFAVGRRVNGYDRLKVYDGGASDNRSVIFAVGGDWGNGTYVTDVAFGDVDGDGRLEIGVTRKSSSNSRFFIYDDLASGGTLLKSGGGDWGSGNYATSIAFGDVDNDGRDEFAIGRKAGENGRYYLYNDASAPGSYKFKLLAIGGADWGSGGYTTALAFGDADGDGKEELAVARKSGTNMRFEVMKWTGNQLQQMMSGGKDWGGSNYATTIAFGNIDNDSGEELLVGRRSDVNARFFLMDDSARNFALIDQGGYPWGDGYYTVGVSFGDLDADNKDEIIVARHARENKRLHVFDYFPSARRISPMPYNEAFPGALSAIDVASGDIDGDGMDDIIIANNADKKGQARFQLLLSGKRVN